MTETSSGLTPPLTDTITVLPILSEAKAPVSVTLTIDKSVSKVAAWVIAVIIINSIVLGAVIVLEAYKLSAQHCM